MSTKWISNAELGNQRISETFQVFKNKQDQVYMNLENTCIDFFILLLILSMFFAYTALNNFSRPDSCP